ncbi:nucleolar MIF4G domain-containing protein 1 homolog [Scaptodrosophila lebanonensis]|uniref:Nucleolar MIF4G domain-containing protein 1 homolog n=1 Tax=Drosophila lebanonensis TaxID=7225 RepID=A0A6J2UDC8_DROLE|nr:nucleolar MIF4G domain-containing protein 1 homolog [Scaptodrosophila lebanonensis]
MAKIKKKEAYKKPLTRKEQRKQKVEQKKIKKRLYYSSKSDGGQRVAAAMAEAAANALATTKNKKGKKGKKPKINPEDIPVEQLLSGEVDADDDDSIDSNFSDEEVDALLPAERKGKVEVYNPLGKKAKKHAGIQREDETKVRQKELRQQKELQSKARKQRLKQLKLENEDEDKEIARLEKKLKLNKTKDKNRLMRKMFSDGLDYVLDLVLDDEEEKVKWEEKQRRKQELKEQQAKEEAGMWSDEDEDETASMDGNDADEAGSEDFDDEEMDASGQEDDEDGNAAETDTDDEEKEEEMKQKETNKYKEDIYGRRRDADGNIIPDAVEAVAAQSGQKYIPPHQRALLAASAGTSEKQAEILARLRKQCKGLLNRLSEANLHKIATGIEELYMKNSRYNMNDTLTALLNEALIGRTRSNERMVQEHMVLLAYLHAHIGSEIGAHFLQMFVEQFDGYVKDMQQLDVEDKRLNNLVLLLCYMYMFKIYEQRLLLELIARLAGNLCEKAVECLLLIFQNVGFRLRKDDPLAFKQMMQNVQSQIAAAPLELKENLRLKFMVDILNAVKNNNMTKLPQYDPELAETLRKRLKGMLRNERYVVTLNITLDDLLRADKVGKWWIVGSAWTGNINEMGSATQTTTEEHSLPNRERFSEKLLQLAKKQHMNTAERRNIFCIIMSAADYVDAFEKILHLSLKDQRTVAYVIIHCALNERKPNPYYAHLALKFCQYNRKFQLAFQFASWDRINDIEALTKAQIKNLAWFLQQLILSAGLQLSVLKVVDFMQLHKLSFYFMREVMVRLLLSTEESALYQAFERVAKNTKLQQFKQSVRLFMQHFLLQPEQLEKLKLEEEQQELLHQRIEHLDKLLAYVDL